MDDNAEMNAEQIGFGINSKSKIKVDLGGGGSP